MVDLKFFIKRKNKKILKKNKKTYVFENIQYTNYFKII